MLCWLLLFVVMLHGWMEQGVNAVFMLFPATATAVSTHQILTPLCLPSLLPHHAFFCHLENTLKLGQRRRGYESVGMTHSIKIVGHYYYCSQHLRLSVSALSSIYKRCQWNFMEYNIRFQLGYYRSFLWKLQRKSVEVLTPLN